MRTNWRFWNRKQRENDLDEEIRAHFAIEERERVERGESVENAGANARLQFGNVALVKEITRDTWGWNGFHTLSRDIDYAIRLLARSPGFTLVALLTIMVTIGGVSTVFTLVDSIVLEPLPFPHAEGLVRITQTDSTLPAFFVSVSEADFVDLRARSSSFEAIAALRQASAYVREGKSAVLLSQAMVTPEWFSVFGIKPALGRPLSPDDAIDGAPTAVLGHEYWQTRLGGNRAIIGKTLRLPRYTGGEDLAFTIVGVMPPEFDALSTGPDVGTPAIWTLLRPTQAPEVRRNRLLRAVVGRLAPGARIETAQAELDALNGRLSAEYPDTNANRSAHVTPLKDEIIEDSASSLWLFLGAVGFVLLIGVANLTNLQIVRNAVRAREIETRAALGASRGRIILQLLAEALTLCSIGGALGIALGWAGARILVAVNPAPFPRSESIGLDASVVLVSLGVVALTGIVFGLAPAWHASKPGLQSMIRSANRHVMFVPRRALVQKVLIGFETGIALVLLVGAALLAHSFWLLFTEDAGMNEERLWRATLTLPPGYDMQSEVDFRLRALREIERLPQVETAGTITSPPLDGSDVMFGGVRPEGDAGATPPDGFRLSVRSVSPGYFRTVGVPIKEGRDFVDSDSREAEFVAILNDAAKRLLFPGSSAIGQRLRLGRVRITRIVGVIPDFKHTQPDRDVAPQLYTPATQAQASIGSGAFMIRLRDAGAGFRQSLERLIADLDPAAAVQIETAGQARWSMFRAERFRASLLLIFASTALFLAMVGVSGVVTYSVAQRKREIGIRVALGALDRDVIRLLVRQVMGPATIGAAAGLLGSLALTRVLAGYLFKVAPTDPVTFGVAAGCLLLASLTATLVPARRATRIDPMTVLREE